MQIPSKCFTKRKQRHETIHQNYPHPMQKMHYKTLSILIGNIPDFVAPKPSFYWPFTCSILHPFFTLIGAMRRGYWAQEEKVVEARKKPKKRAEEAGLEPHPISQERQDNTDHTSFTSKWNTQKGLLQIATEQDKGGNRTLFSLYFEADKMYLKASKKPHPNSIKTKEERL